MVVGSVLGEGSVVVEGSDDSDGGVVGGQDGGASGCSDISVGSPSAVLVGGWPDVVAGGAPVVVECGAGVAVVEEAEDVGELDDGLPEAGGFGCRVRPPTAMRLAHEFPPARATRESPTSRRPSA